MRRREAQSLRRVQIAKSLRYISSSCRKAKSMSLRAPLSRSQPSLTTSLVKSISTTMMEECLSVHLAVRKSAFRAAMTTLATAKMALADSSRSISRPVLVITHTTISEINERDKNIQILVWPSRQRRWSSEGERVRLTQ